jgi:hypothetical protein
MLVVARREKNAQVTPRHTRQMAWFQVAVLLAAFQPYWNEGILS